MNSRSDTLSLILWWIARVAGLAVLVPLMQIAFGEHGTGPADVRRWIYLALFPFGFAVGYFAGWRWPLFGGCLSLACMAASLLVIGKTFPLAPYVIWGIVSVPGVLFVIAGWRMRRKAREAGPAE